MAEDEDWGRVARAVEARLAELRMDRSALARAAEVDRKTVDNFLDRGMKPRTNKRGGYEAALAWGWGSMLTVARGGDPDVWPADPVERMHEAARRLERDRQEDVAEPNSQAEVERAPLGTPSLSVVPATVEPDIDDDDDEDSEVLRAIAADPNLDEISREHFTSQYKILRKFTRYRREHERLPYVAHGKREDPVDPAEEARIEEEARRAARDNPHSPGGDK